MTQRVVTIKDIAERAGVSVSAVSHVLNGNNARVGASKRERVLEVVRELNYRPNAIARSMAKKATSTVGLVVDNVYGTIHPTVLKEVEASLRANGYHMLLANTNNYAENIAETVQTMLAQQVAGLIFVLPSKSYSEEPFLYLKSQGIPFVAINRYFKANDINQVNFDDWGVGYTATRHLIALGHTRIGLISGPLQGEPSWVSAVARFEGWERALHEATLAVNPSWIIDGEYEAEKAYQAVQAWLKTTPANQLPTALFVGSFSMAMATLRAIHEVGLKIPQDIAVVAVDDVPMSAYTYPSLTTVALPLEEAGGAATKILLDWIKSGQPPYTQHLKLGSKLVVRASCGAKLLPGQA